MLSLRQSRYEKDVTAPFDLFRLSAQVLKPANEGSCPVVVRKAKGKTATHFEGLGHGASISTQTLWPLCENLQGVSGTRTTYKASLSPTLSFLQVFEALNCARDSAHSLAA